VRFWDSSAVVPLLVAQRNSTEADRWLGEDGVIALWTLTPVEIASAIHRLVRDGLLAERQADEAERRTGELVDASHVVVDVESVKRRAHRLVRLHPLRAADALQLGAALEWAAGHPGGSVLHTFDTRLATAARREGFLVLPEAS
jgi:predicted nucleic acid-binding protein